MSTAPDSTRGLLPRALVYLAAFAMLGFGWIAVCGMWQYQHYADGVAPLAPREFEAFSVVTVGTGDAFENPDRLGPTTAIALGTRVVLVDVGRGVSEALRSARIPVGQPDTVFLTSLLPETTVGLDDLLLTGWLAPREEPLRVLGPPGTRRLVEGIAKAHAEGARVRGETSGLPAAGGTFVVEEVADGFTAGSGDLAVRAAALPGGPLPALAWRFEAEGRAVVVGGPGWAPDALVALAEGASVLVHAAVNRESIDLARETGAENLEAIESEAALLGSLEDAARVAARAGVGTLVLTRLRPPPLLDFQYESVVAGGFSGDVVIAEDGDEIAP